MKKEYINQLIYVTAIFAVVAAAYVNVLNMEYVWDDWYLFVNDANLRLADSFGSIRDAVFRPILPATTYFRPLVLLSFVAQFKVFGDGAFGGHLINLILHLVNVCLVYFLVERALRLNYSSSKAVQIYAVTAALVYGLHPAMVEPVAWISGRFDLMVTTFSLLAMALFLYPKTWRRDIGVATIFFLAGLCKEQAFILPGVLVLLTCALDGREVTGWQRLKSAIVCERRLLVILGVSLIALLWVRHMLMGRVGHVDMTVWKKLGGLAHFAFVGWTILFYLRAVINPFSGISPQHPFDLELLQGGGLVAGVCVTVISVFVILNLLLGGRKMALPFVVLLLALLPVLNIVPLTIAGNIGHERFLTFPLATFVIFISILGWPKMIGWIRSYRSVCFLPVVWLSGSVLVVVSTLPMWGNDLTLWGWVYEKHPKNEYVARSFAAAAYKYGKFDVLEKILDEMDGFSARPEEVSIFRGALQVRLGRPDEGVKLIEGGLLNLKFELPHIKIQKMGVGIDSIQMDARDYVHAADLTFAYTALADGYLAKKNYEAALVNTKIARLYSPRHPPAALVQAFSFYGLGDFERGDQVFSEVLKYVTTEGRVDVLSLRIQYFKALCLTKSSSVACLRVPV